MKNLVKLEAKEVRVAYCQNLPKAIVDELVDIEAVMCDNNGGGQYKLENLRDRFDEESDEYMALNELIEQNYDYLEYS